MAYRNPTTVKRPDRTYDPTKVQEPDIEKAGSPEKETFKDQEQFQMKSVKDIQIGVAITPQADPSKEAAQASLPYQLLARNNRIIDRGYKGDNNLSGNILPVMLNDGSSKLLDTIDIFNMKVNLRYLMMATQAAHKNHAVNREMLKTFDEAISKAYAETFTQLSIFDYVVTSTMPVIGTNKSILTMLVGYQSYLQNVALLINYYNRALAMEKHLKTMVFNREEPFLNEIYGLLKKSALRAKFDSIATATYGEYLDVEWAKTVNSIVMVPSRKTKGMKTPLMMITGSHVQDFASATLASVSVYNEGQWQSGKLINAIDKLNPFGLIKWARQYAQGDTTTTPTNYYNALVDDLNDVLNGLQTFKSQVVDLRTLLDVLSRVGLNNWSRGIKLTLENRVSYEPVCNRIVDDIYQSTFAGSPDVVFNETTQRWSIFSLWDRYYGIPAYEKTDGGAFIVFSTRTLPTEADPNDYLKTRYLVPQMFDVTLQECLSRKGHWYSVSSTLLDNAALEGSSAFTRLNTLSQSQLTLKLPVLGEVTTPVNRKSMLIDAVSTAYGLGLITRAAGTYYEVTHPDKICFLDTQIDDISNKMIGYCKAYGPLRIVKPARGILQ